MCELLYLISTQNMGDYTDEVTDDWKAIRYTKHGVQLPLGMVQ